MKRIGNLYQKICSLDNLILAESKARKGKSKHKDIIKFDLDNKNKLLHIMDGYHGVTVKILNVNI